MTATETVYYQDSYLKDLETQVSAVDGEWIETTRTIFYPEGGGQPGDTGTLTVNGTTFRITDTRKSPTPGVIRHQLDTADHGLAPGDGVHMTIDWERRYRHMRMHTCLHLLGALIPVPVTGGAVGAEKSRLDFDLGDHAVDKEDLTNRINALISAGSALTFEKISEAELDAHPELVRTMSVQPPRGAGDIRMVRVSDVDYQPCGGTHVNNTGEIGKVLIAKIENKGKKNRRIHVVFDEH